MKKTFPLHEPGKASPRVVDAIKHEVRKYVKRERRKTIPAGFDQWNFDCRIGATAATAEPKAIDDVAAAIDAAAGATALYVEIIAVPGHRAPRITTPEPVVAPIPLPPVQSS